MSHSNLSVAKPAESSQGTHSIKNLPINLFGSVMGLAGLSLAWRLASPGLSEASIFGVILAEFIGMLSALVFVLLAVGYTSKWIKHPEAVKAEFSHPVTGNFFGTVTIALLLLSAIAMSYSTLLGQVLWAVGSGLTVLLAAVVVFRLLSGGREAQLAVPAWLIPGVAALDIAVTGAHMPMAWAHELNLFAIAMGSTLAVVLFNRIFARLIHEPAMAKGMTPSLMVMVAPFAVGFLAYVNVFGAVDRFASVLFYFGLFLFVVLAFKVFRNAAPFSPVWWSISFPIAALSNAALKYADAQQSLFLSLVAYGLLVFLTLALAVMLVKTVKMALDGRLFAS